MSVINNEKCVMLFTYGINLIKKGDIPILGVNARIKQLQILPYHAILKDMTGLQVKNSAEQ